MPIYKQFIITVMIILGFIVSNCILWIHLWMHYIVDAFVTILFKLIILKYMFTICIVILYFEY